MRTRPAAIRGGPFSRAALVGKRVGSIVLTSESEGRIESRKESRHVRRRRTSPARYLQPPGLVQPRRTVGRADCAGRSAHRRRAAARRRRRPDRLAADRADAAVHPVRDSGRPARRPHLAALADGGLGGAARRGACRHPAADLARPDDAAAAFAARLHRGVRNGGLQRRRTGSGAVAGDVATTARSQCADRTGAHDRVRQRPGARRRAGRMGRRRARLRLCRGVIGRRRRAAVGHP